MTSLSWAQLGWCLLPLMLLFYLFYRWQLPVRQLINAAMRMVLQLLLAGYVLLFIFANDSIGMLALVLSVMLLAASWIALGPVRKQPGLWRITFFALLATVLSHLLITLLILTPEPWYQLRTLLPLAGMYFANAMTSISLACERYFSERDKQNSPHQSAKQAFSVALLPQLNAWLAVGVVALPGMMTGQILAGVSPLVAVRYQIMIMVMLLSCAALASGIVLGLLKKGHHSD